MKQAVIFFSILIIVIGGFGYFISWPMYQEWSTYQTQVTKLDGELKIVKERRAVAKQIEAAATTIHEKATTAKQLIPVQEERESFISEYDALTKNNGVNLAILNFAKAAASAPKPAAGEDADDSAAAQKKTTKKVSNTSTPLLFNSVLIGDYSAIRKVLAELRSTKRYTTVNNLSVGSNDAGVAITLDGQIYTKPEPSIPSSLSVNSSIWEYLDKHANAASDSLVGQSTTTGRPNPFIAY